MNVMLRPGDLPELESPDGYQRGADGRWRYTDGGGVVPGARDLTMGRLWRFRARADHVLVPIDLSLVAPELAWCRSANDGLTVIDRRGKVPAAQAWLVRIVDWEERKSVPLGLDAPELAPARLLGVAQIAAMYGVEESTVRSWASRQVLPRPVLSHQPGPAWSLPIVQRCMAVRGVQQSQASGPSTRQSLKQHEQPGQHAAKPKPPAKPADTEFETFLSRLDKAMGKGKAPVHHVDENAGSRRTEAS